MGVGHIERLFAREAFAPPGARGVAYVARGQPVPFYQVEDHHALLLWGGVIRWLSALRSGRRGGVWGTVGRGMGGIAIGWGAMSTVRGVGCEG